jgi:histidinol-phosphate aminotransferase
MDLRLDGNEGEAPAADVLAALAVLPPERVRRYPDARPLERLWAGMLSVSPDHLLVTAGADEALDRVMRAFVPNGGEVILPVPTFEMLPRYARLAGGTVTEVEWPGGKFPTEVVCSRVSAATAVIAVVSPNNPTGAVATAADLRYLARAAPHAILLVDLAYGEFASVDLFATAAALPNAVATRTLSKAWGLAGVRIGCAVAAPEITSALRTAAGPYTVAGLSIALAEAALVAGGRMPAFVAGVRRRRAALRLQLLALGAEPLPSEANFVLARFVDAGAVARGLAGRGIAVRSFPGDPRLASWLRFTVPICDADLERLFASLAAVAARTSFAGNGEAAAGSDPMPGRRPPRRAASGLQRPSAGPKG